MIIFTLVACIAIAYQIGDHDDRKYSSKSPTDYELAKDRTDILNRRPVTDRSICSEAKTEKEYELCQGWRSSDAARDSANWALLQAVIAGVALIGLGMTVHFTKRAADGALKAAQAAHDSSVTADSTLRAMQANAKRELRTYIGITNVIVTRFVVDNHAEVEFVVKNFGKTPAYKYRYWAELKVAPVGETDFSQGNARYTALSTINPDEERTSVSERIEDVVTQDQFEEVVTKQTSRLFFFGRIEFVDAFDKGHWMDFRYEYGRPVTVKRRGMAICKKGNESSDPE